MRKASINDIWCSVSHFTYYWAKFLGKDRLFCLITISKFGNFQNPFVTITSLNFTLVTEDLFGFFKHKKPFLPVMAAEKAAKNHGDEWDLTWYLQWGIYIYISIPAWIHWQVSVVAAEKPSLKLSFHGLSL